MSWVMAVTPFCHYPSMPSFIISCDSCVLRCSAACADCVVTHLLAPAPRERIEFDAAEMSAVRLLAAAGMVPTLRHREAC